MVLGALLGVISPTNKTKEEFGTAENLGAPARTVLAMGPGDVCDHSLGPAGVLLELAAGPAPPRTPHSSAPPLPSIRGSHRVTGDLHPPFAGELLRPHMGPGTEKVQWPGDFCGLMACGLWPQRPPVHAADTGPCPPFRFSRGVLPSFLKGQQPCRVNSKFMSTKHCCFPC